jgi:transposase-like protein
VVRIFPNREACLRLVTALAAEHSDEWLSGRRYLDVGLLTDAHDGLPEAALAAD